MQTAITRIALIVFSFGLVACGAKQNPVVAPQPEKEAIAALSKKIVEANARIDDLGHQIYIIRDLLENNKLALQRLQGSLGGQQSKSAPTTAPSFATAPNTPTTTGAKPPKSPVVAGRVGETAPLDKTTEQYFAAYDYYQNQDYDQAIGGFDAFIKQNPTHDYVPNALYWMGESYYDKKEFLIAIEQFNKIAKHHPSSNKYPDAMLKLAYSHGELGNLPETRRYLQLLIDQHPNTLPGKKALERLHIIGARN